MSADVPSFKEAARVWLRVAALSFGGPAAQIATMHRIVVEEKRWVSDARFLHALNYCMLLPGPEAQQLSIYLGWLLHRTAGGLTAGLLFVAPGALALMGLSVVYVLYGQVGIVAGLFFGLKAGVLAVIAQAWLRLARRALRTGALRALAAAAFVALFFLHAPFPLVIALAGAIGALALPAPPPAHGGDSALGEATPPHAQPSLARFASAVAIWLPVWLAPVAALWAILSPDNIFSRLATFFSGTALITFGGAYSVLAFVAQQAVEHFHWLSAHEMLDGLGLAETTPGPLIMVLQFVGFLAAFRAPGALPPLLSGVLGGLLTTWVTFAPCFLWVFAGAPFVEALRGVRALSAALSAISAAVVGVILNLTVWLAIHTLFRETVAVLGFDAPVWGTVNLPAVALALAAAAALFGTRAGATATLAASAAAGAALRGLGWVAA
jgi:chromate transporter